MRTLSVKELSLTLQTEKIVLRWIKYKRTIDPTSSKNHMHRRRSPRKQQLSLVVCRTEQLLITLIGCGALFLGVLYLIWSNHMSIQAQVLGMESQKYRRIADNLSAVEAQIAKEESNRYIHQSEHLQKMIAKEDNQRYVILQSKFTARK